MSGTISEVNEAKPNVLRCQSSLSLIHFGDDVLQKTKTLINSEEKSEIQFSLNAIKTSFDIIPEFFSLFPRVIDLLDSDPELEFAAIEISKIVLENPTFCLEASQMLIEPLFNRLQHSPAVEFVSLFSLICRLVPDSVIKQIISKAFDMLSKNDQVQHAGSAILLALPSEKVELSNQDFSKLLQSNVFVQYYLFDYVQKRNNPQWFLNVAVPHLVLIAQSNTDSRNSIVKTILSFVASLEIPILTSFIRMCFTWSQKSDQISIEIIEHHPLFVKDINKVRSLIQKVSTTTITSIKQRLFNVLIQSNLFSGNTKQLSAVFKNLFNPISIEDHRLILNFIPLIYKTFSQPEIKDNCFTFFTSCFNVKDVVLLKEMATSTFYSFLEIKNFKRLMPSFLKLFQEFKNNWRYMKSCIEMFTSFPDEIIEAFANQAFTSVISSIDNIHPLKSVICAFLVRIYCCCDQKQHLLRLIEKEFLHSEYFVKRAFFAYISISFIRVVDENDFKTYFFNNCIKLLNDKINSVVISFVRQIPTLREYFFSVDDTESLLMLQNILKKLDGHSDILIKDVRNEVMKYNPKRQPSVIPSSRGEPSKPRQTPNTPIKNAKNSKSVSLTFKKISPRKVVKKV